jgi:hypothetical protein
MTNILIIIGDIKHSFLENEHGTLLVKEPYNTQEVDIQQVILIEVSDNNKL